METLTGDTHDRTAPEYRARGAAARSRASTASSPARYRALAARPMAGARGALLLLGGPAKQRLQARAGGHQPLSRRIQQPQSRFPPALRAGGDGRLREDLS